jgi:hypothetical protein
LFVYKYLYIYKKNSVSARGTLPEGHFFIMEMVEEEEEEDSGSDEESDSASKLFFIAITACPFIC